MTRDAVVSRATSVMATSCVRFFASKETRDAVFRAGLRTESSRLASGEGEASTSARADVETAGALRKVLTRMDLTMLGVGGIVGAGVFVLTGAVAHDHAGPAVVFSYALSALTSAVTGLAYAEFAVAMPVAGSAYNYMYATFGEYAAFLTGCNLALELTIASAAIARGWTSYATTAFGIHPTSVRATIFENFIEIDMIAGLVVFGMTVLLVIGAKETAKFNAVVTYASLLVVAVVLIAGSTEIHPSNWTPFAPNGMRGIISGASVVVFAFVGFDTVATCAEEVANPSADLPFGILGSLGICATLYCLMCIVITGMIPYGDIDVHAPFAIAFSHYGMKWIASTVSIGAVAAITTSLLLSMMGQPRIFMVMARDGLLPNWFSSVSEKYGTPANASVFSGVVTGVLAVLLDIDILAQLVSIGTLSIFCGVNLGLIVSRCAPRRASLSQRAPAFRRAAALLVSSLAFGIDYRARARLSWFGGVSLAGVVASTASFLTLPMDHAPKTFRTPFVPFLPAFGVLLTCVLIAGLGVLAWIRYVVYTAACSAVYLAFAVRRADAELASGGVDPDRPYAPCRPDATDDTDDDGVVEVELSAFPTAESDADGAETAETAETADGAETADDDRLLPTDAESSSSHPARA